jgi:hypothetical protein
MYELEGSVHAVCPKGFLENSCLLKLLAAAPSAEQVALSWGLGDRVIPRLCVHN